MFSFDSIYNCSEHVNLYRQQQQARRERRPDRAVYIPRARRSQTTPPTTTTQIQQQPPAPPPPPLISAQVSTANGTTIAVGTITTTATTANYTSKSLNQQLAITLDDTTAATVNDKPSSDEVGKTAGSGSNNTTKKREKISKDTRERREQRLSKKFLSAQPNHNSKNNTKSNENTNNKTSDDEFSPHAVIVIAQKTATPSVHLQQSSSPTTDVVNSIEENLSPIATTTTTKVFNCDREQEQERVELLLNESSSEYCIDSNRMKESRVLGNYLNINQNDNLAINEFEAAHLLSPPGDEPTDTVRKNFANISNNPFTNITNDINTMPKPSNKAKSHKASSGVDNAKIPNLRIEDVAATQPTKCDIEEQELQRASKVCVQYLKKINVNRVRFLQLIFFRFIDGLHLAIRRCLVMYIG